jgi:hypothetical protein
VRIGWVAARGRYDFLTTPEYMANLGATLADLFIAGGVIVGIWGLVALFIEWRKFKKPPVGYGCQ